MPAMTSVRTKMNTAQTMPTMKLSQEMSAFPGVAPEKK